MIPSEVLKLEHVIKLYIWDPNTGLLTFVCLIFCGVYQNDIAAREIIGLCISQFYYGVN
jgi:hypothetical protein